MAIKENIPNRTIDLTMEEGNVFGLMGMALKLAKQLEKDGSAIIQEMTASDYGNAVAVFDREFGDYFDIILPKNMSVKGVNDSYNRATMTEEKMEEIYTK